MKRTMEQIIAQEVARHFKGLLTMKSGSQLQVRYEPGDTGVILTADGRVWNVDVAAWDPETAAEYLENVGDDAPGE